jgi:hypothetical protein
VYLLLIWGVISLRKIDWMRKRDEDSHLRYKRPPKVMLFPTESTRALYTTHTQTHTRSPHTHTHTHTHTHALISDDSDRQSRCCLARKLLTAARGDSIMDWLFDARWAYRCRRCLSLCSFCSERLLVVFFCICFCCIFVCFSFPNWCLCSAAHLRAPCLCCSFSTFCCVCCVCFKGVCSALSHSPRLLTRVCLQVALAAVVVLSMVFVVRHNLYSVGASAHYGPSWQFVGAVCGLHQRWNMFRSVGVV